MRTATLLALTVTLACRTPQPVGPLTGAYAIVFDASFSTAIRMGTTAFPAGDVESAIRELFTERDGAFQWFHENPKDPGLFDAVIVLHIMPMNGPGSSIVENRDTTGLVPEETLANMGYEIRRTDGRKSFGSVGIHAPSLTNGQYEPRRLLETASDLYAILNRELQK